MQIFFKQNLACLAVPKTGTTAYELALRADADIIFARRRKHMTAGQFDRKIAPFLQDSFDFQPERMAVMRHPIEQIRSWYRYRTAPKSKRLTSTTADISFDDFVRGVLNDPQTDLFGIGSQYNFLTLKDGSIPIHHLFAYETQPLIKSFLGNRFGKPINPKPKNISPPKPTPLSPEVESLLRKARAPEFALYDRILQAGGHFQPFCG